MSFFVLKEWSRDAGAAFQTDYLIVEPSHTGQADRCEACGKFVSMLAWLPPYRVELECWGRSPGDLAFGVGSYVLVSERFKCLYEEIGIVGLTGFDPVEIVRVKRRARGNSKPLNYYCTRVARSHAAIDQQASGFQWKGEAVCPVCRLGPSIERWNRIVIEPGTWVGEDVFIARGAPGTILASARFKGFCESYKITNAVLVPAEEYSYDDCPQNQRE